VKTPRRPIHQVSSKPRDSVISSNHDLATCQMYTCCNNDTSTTIPRPSGVGTTLPSVESLGTGRHSRRSLSASPGNPPHKLSHGAPMSHTAPAGSQSFALMSPDAPTPHLWELLNVTVAALEVPGVRGRPHAHPETLRRAFKRGELQCVYRAGALLTTRAWLKQWLVRGAEEKLNGVQG
jgi:hypothetical protein